MTQSHAGFWTSVVIFCIGVPLAKKWCTLHLSAEPSMALIINNQDKHVDEEEVAMPWPTGQESCWNACYVWLIHLWGSLPLRLVSVTCWGFCGNHNAKIQWIRCWEHGKRLLMLPMISRQPWNRYHLPKRMQAMSATYPSLETHARDGYYHLQMLQRPTSLSLGLIYNLPYPSQTPCSHHPCHPWARALTRVSPSLSPLILYLTSILPCMVIRRSSHTLLHPIPPSCSSPSSIYISHTHPIK